MLRCIQRPETDPYFNLAAEEYLLHTAACDTFMLWRNDRAVIIGKHQNLSREINHRFIESSGIPVIRRITGGGTVYHDLGNINFSFIRLNRKENPIDFKFFTRPVIIFLNSMGIRAEFEGKSNITVGGKKVSGNSAHVFKGRVLHHGTLLYDTDLRMLDRAILASEEKYSDKSVRSMRKEVTNLAAHVPAVLSAEDFMESFFSFIINHYQDAIHDSLDEKEREAIAGMAERKYMDPRWNVGYSPDYQYTDTWMTEDGPFTVNFTTREAVIENASITGPAAFSDFLETICKSLTGTLHEKSSVEAQLSSLTFANEKESMLLNQIIGHLF